MIYNSPDGSIDQRFRLLSNYFGPIVISIEDLQQFYLSAPASLLVNYTNYSLIANLLASTRSRDNYRIAQPQPELIGVDVINGSRDWLQQLVFWFVCW